MLDEFADQGGREGTIQTDGVPVTLVHVKAGSDGVIFLAEEDGAVRVALEVQRGGKFSWRRESTELAGNFEDEDLGTEGSAGLRPRKGLAKIARGGKIHGTDYQLARAQFQEAFLPEIIQAFTRRALKAGSVIFAILQIAVDQIYRAGIPFFDPHKEPGSSAVAFEVTLPRSKALRKAPVLLHRGTIGVTGVIGDAFGEPPRVRLRILLDSVGKFVS